MAPGSTSWGMVYGSLLSWRHRQRSSLTGKPITPQSETAPSARHGMPGNEHRHFAWVDGTSGAVWGACFGPHSSNRLSWKGPEVEDVWPDCYRSLANHLGSGESPTKPIVTDGCWGELLLWFIRRWPKKGQRSVSKIIAGFQRAAVRLLRAHRGLLSASLWSVPAGRDLTQMLYRCWQRVERSLWTCTHQQLPSAKK